MSSIIKLEKLKGDGTQDVKAWFYAVCQFHDLPDSKKVNLYPLYLEGHAKVWYNSFPYEHKINTTLLTSLFQERFREFENFWDLSILQLKQEKTEPVEEFFNKTYKKKTI